mmetsp:Transcript_19156/g.25235  ORF Transcript_19156/g.25235 Transcript_19156/m.25235 type:complete len:131 (+) Transcript_19156:249-641(+)|eukprot:CAMPEP_0117754030 /NCGR_PEP_ID=MMETSP0947-20121206/12589_1 /TAXON_ID=44440 /ORGANISM="Chattonella subsalsa, Strain CCMP2191" /LENGTH=130 /DNA_ID=CAMNT_0005573047 /DNA_START=176 /DNA_END=568 /DNA_ORIENTATION=+
MVSSKTFMILVCATFSLASSLAFVSNTFQTNFKSANSLSMQLDMPKLSPKILPAIAAAIPSSVLAAVEEVDDYQYGAVSAPGWILPVGALAVIVTAAVPILLQSGQEAFDEISENSKDKWAGGRYNKKDE